MSSLAVRNGSVLLPDGSIRRCDIRLREGRIDEIGDRLAAECEIDADGAYVLPGLIDIHTHGIGYEAAGTSGLHEYARLEAEKGATTFIPTLFAPPEEIAEQMRRRRQETDDLMMVPQVAGFRLESPYLASTGAGISRDLAPVTEKTTNMLLEAGGGLIRIWDISPELEGAPEAIRGLSERGIVCSLAHTNATVEQGRAAVEAGARLVTHLFDVFTQPEVTEPGVYPAGLVDYFLVEDRVCCEIIGDGTHVSPLHIEKAFRCKTPTLLAFVTDSNLGAGLPPGDYDLPGGWGRARITDSNNGVRLIDRDMGLAGSALTPIDSLRNTVRLFGKDLATAVKVCSTTPSELLGLNKGRIAVGKDADLIVLDGGLNLLHTIAGGKVIYSR